MRHSRLKYLADVIPGQSPPSTEVSYLDGGLPFIQGNAEFGELSPKPIWQCEESPQIAEAEDVLVSVRAPVGAVNIAAQPMGIGRGIAAIRPKKSNLSKWIYWALIAHKQDLLADATGSTFSAVSGTDVGNLRLSLCQDPTVVADFLDRETAEIDAFIADQERLIELLEERRAATITHAVTKGLDPTVPMRDSGIEWIGRVPGHWNVPKATWVGRVFSSAPTGEPELDKEARIPFLKVSSLSSTGFTPAPYHWFVTPGQNLERDFIVFPKRGAAIFGNKVNIVAGIVAMDPNLMGWKLSPEHSQLYFAYVLKTVELEGIADVSTVPQINTKHMSALQIPAPPLEEQRAIADFLNRETAEIDAAVLDAREAIALSRERRATLISAAVTGQIDVSQMQRPVDEVLEQGVWV